MLDTSGRSHHDVKESYFVKILGGTCLYAMTPHQTVITQNSTACHYGQKKLVKKNVAGMTRRGGVIYCCKRWKRGTHGGTQIHTRCNSSPSNSMLVVQVFHFSVFLDIQDNISCYLGLMTRFCFFFILFMIAKTFSEIADITDTGSQRRTTPPPRLPPPIPHSIPQMPKMFLCYSNKWFPHQTETLLTIY